MHYLLLSAVLRPRAAALLPLSAAVDQYLLLEQCSAANPPHTK